MKLLRQCLSLAGYFTPGRRNEVHLVPYVERCTIYIPKMCMLAVLVRHFVAIQDEGVKYGVCSGS